LNALTGFASVAAVRGPKSAAALAVIAVCVLVVGAPSQATTATERSATCTSDPAAAPTITVPRSITFTDSEECVYKISLKFGDTLHLASGTGGEIDGNLYIPGGGQLEGYQVCADGYNEWSLGRGSSLACAIPKTTNYYLKITFGYGQRLDLSLSHPRRGTYTVVGSCAIATAPRVRMNTLQFGAGLICPSGREYFKMALKARQRVVFQWTAMTSLGNVPDYARNSGVYPPGTNEFTINKRRTCGESTYSGSGGQVPLEICIVRRTGIYLLAVGWTPVQFYARLKH
jgi:hypothetical protein